MVSKLYTVLTFVFCSFLSCALMIGQVFTSGITGVVTDPTGAAVTGAAIKVVNRGTGDTRTATTGTSGEFKVSQLPPGPYDVTVTMTGFKTFVASNLSLVAGLTAEQNAALSVGDASTSVEVKGDEVAIDTQSANKQVTFDSGEMVAIPNSLRSPLLFVHSTAGVAAVRTGLTPYMTDQNTNRFSLNGGRDESSAILVDGVSIVAPSWGGAIAVPSQDSVAETQVNRQAYDPQYGKTDGGVVSLVTKSGSGQFHGGGFEFLRNDHLDANSWANNFSDIARQTFRRNQWGGNVGGPLWKSKKLYFFSAFEALQQATPQTQVTSVPTNLERTGNFSQTFNSDGTPAIIYNPFSTALAANGNYLRTPFAGNSIPATLINSVGAKALGLFPVANQTGSGITNANNWAGSANLVSNYYKIDERVDWIKSEKYQLFGRLTKAWQVDGIPLYFKNGADNTGGEEDPRFEAIVGQTFVVNPTLVVNVLVGSGRWHEIDTTASSANNGTLVGLPQSLVNQLAINTLPQFNVSGYAQLGNTEYATAARESHNLQLNVSKQAGNHTIKTGFMFEIQRLNTVDQLAATFNFDRGLTSGPIASTAATDSGSALASLLLGTGAGGDAPYNAAVALLQRNFAWYVQDVWRVNPRLTLTAGLRYEIQAPRTERYNRLNSFATQAVSPLSQSTGLNLDGGLVFANSNQRGWWNTDYTNFDPRVALAYKISDKLVFRAGYGIFNSTTIASLTNSTSDGYSTDTNWVSTVGGGGIIPGALVSNPFPQGLNQPVGSSLGLLTEVGQSVNAMQRSHPTPYVQTYSADFQYQLNSASLIELGYSGTQGRKLLYGVSPNVNQLNPSYLSLGNALNNSVANPFYGKITNGPLSGATIPAWQLLLPYPQFQSVNLTGDTPGASSSFNALLAKYSQHLRGGFTVLATYQWSKSIDDTSEVQAWEVKDAISNVYNLSANRSISAHDLPQDFVGNAIWEIPVGKGRAFGSNMNKIANSVVGGWQFSTVVRIGSGLPLQFRAPNDLGTYGFSVLRPDLSSYSALTNVTRSPGEWFNTSALTTPAPYTLGNLARYVGSVRAMGNRNADLMLTKSFDIYEHTRLQIRFESYNLTNTPQYGRADTTVGDPGFGTVTSTINSGPRNIQIGARLDF